MSGSLHDVIGYWSEVKLHIIREYAAAYSTVVSKQSSIRRHLYIDAFAGSGMHLSKKSGELVRGSPAIALEVKPPYSEYHFIDLDGDKTEELRRLASGRSNVCVWPGDCNEILIDSVFPRCRYEDYVRALCLLDPYDLGVNWKVLAAAGKSRSIEIFFNFMIMDANMNAFFRDPEKISTEQRSRINAAWGDESWRQAAYRMEPGFFGEIEEKAGNEEIADAFRQRLKNEAGFKYVPRPMPMRNSRGAVIYYLFFASPNKTGMKIVEEIFDKYRHRGI